MIYVSLFTSSFRKSGGMQLFEYFIWKISAIKNDHFIKPISICPIKFVILGLYEMIEKRKWREWNEGNGMTEVEWRRLQEKNDDLQKTIKMMIYRRLIKSKEITMLINFHIIEKSIELFSSKYR